MWQQIQELFQQKTGKDLSIFEHVYAHINPVGPGLLPGGENLPDDDDFFGRQKIRWIPGATDVVIGHPDIMSEKEKQKRVDFFVNAFRKTSKNPSLGNIEELERVLSMPETLSIIDNVLKAIIVDKTIDQSILYQVCRYLFLYSRQRGAVKFSTAILGLYGVAGDLELFKIIARHDEFTLYAAVAIMGHHVTVADLWMEMAKKVRGWGRIHLVGRLLDIKNDEVRDFLLREGCRNDVMPEYTSHRIAERMKLLNALKPESIDRELFEGAGVILSSLVHATGSDCPFLGMDEYREGEDTVREFLRHAEKMSETLEDYLVVNNIGTTAISINEGGCREHLKWSNETFDLIKTKVENILQNSFSRDEILKAVESEDAEEQWRAITISLMNGLDIREKLMDLLKSNPCQARLWFVLMQGAKDSSVDEIVEMALKLWKGREWGRHSAILIPGEEDEYMECMETLIRELQSFPGRGWELLKKGLRTQKTEIKNLVIKTLYNWNGDLIESEIRGELIRLLEDPQEDEGVRIGVENLLQNAWKTDTILRRS